MSFLLCLVSFSSIKYYLLIYVSFRFPYMLHHAEEWSRLESSHAYVFDIPLYTKRRDRDSGLSVIRYQIW